MHWFTSRPPVSREEAECESGGHFFKYTVTAGNRRPRQWATQHRHRAIGIVRSYSRQTAAVLLHAAGQPERKAAPHCLPHGLCALSLCLAPESALPSFICSFSFVVCCLLISPQFTFSILIAI